jgi:hypothetical protein
MSELTIEEKFIINKLEENGEKLDFKKLQSLCEDKFEGVRLILKKLKEKGYVFYDGVMPMYDSIIELMKKE